MSKILIVGNVLEDIYLRLDEQHENLETDENGTKWLNLGFNDSKHEFFGRENLLSGAAVTKEVLENFGHVADIYDEPARSPETPNTPNIVPTRGYRYILVAGNQISYLSPARKIPTPFSPKELAKKYDWIFLDRSAILSIELVQNLIKLIDSTHIHLAFYVPKQLPAYVKPLLRVAKLIFSDNPFLVEQNTVAVRHCLPDNLFLLSETGIKSEKDSIKFKKLTKTNLYTHLTTYSIIAATILGSRLNQKTKQEQLLMAKINIENSKLSGTLPEKDLENLAAEEQASAIDLHQMAKQLVSNGKGILAADESGGSIHKKFESMHIPDDYQHRRDYRNLFFTTPDLEKYVNGVILFDETARQTADDGRDFVKYLTGRGIIPGIKVDKGLANMPGSQEKYTLGLNGLDERLEEYFDMGLRFAKWRAAFEITPTTPTKNTVYKNVEILASYAKKCQEANIVPIVEPEVVFDGDYPVEHSAAITGIILKELFAELERQEVDLAATILKVNMILAGKQYKTQSTPKEVGDWTAKVLKKYVPETLAGVVFLSGGQTPEQATENLQEVTNHGPFPWPVTFSYARALQGPALEAWQGNNKNYPAAKAAFKERLEANCKALQKSL